MKLYSLFFLVSLSSCTIFYHGTLSESKSPEEDASIVSFARGYTKTTRFWGIGDFNRNALIAGTKKDSICGMTIFDR